MAGQVPVGFRFTDNSPSNSFLMENESFLGKTNIIFFLKYFGIPLGFWRKVNPRCCGCCRHGVDSFLGSSVLLRAPPMLLSISLWTPAHLAAREHIWRWFSRRTSGGERSRSSAEQDGRKPVPSEGCNFSWRTGLEEKRGEV